LNPKGWHISKKNEWKLLIDKFEFSPLDLISKIGWGNNIGNNNSGFNAIPCNNLLYDAVSTPNGGFFRSRPDGFVFRFYTNTGQKPEKGNRLF
jgi:uncharacterized protein (TIGR02145 family)